MSTRIEEALVGVKMYRLSLDMKAVEKGISENVQEEKNEKDNFFKKLGKNVSNSMKKSRTEGFEKNKAAIEAEVKKLTEQTPEFTKEEGLKDTLTSLFPNEEAKTAFSILYILSDTFEYKEEDETFKAVSRLLFENDDTLGNIRKNLNSHYGKIANGIGLFGNLKSNDETILALEMYLSILGNVKGKEALKLVSKASDAFEAPVDTKSAAVVIAALLLVGKEGLIFSDDEKDNLLFFNLKKEDLQNALAIRLSLFEVAKKGKEDVQVKNATKAILVAISSLRLTCEEMMIIEKKDQENAKEKLKGISSFVDELADLLK